MNKKNSFQKASNIIGKLCFFLSVVSAIFLYFKVEEYGMQHAVSASFLASAFFFIFTGVVLIVIANADIPSFKINTNKAIEPSKELDN